LSLGAWQTALAETVARAARRDTFPIRTRSTSGTLTKRERVALEQCFQSAGLRLTARIQRQWSMARLQASARLTLAALPEAPRTDLLERWLDRKGEVSWYYAAEAEAFLAYALRRLAGQRVHVRAICRFELAAHRAMNWRGHELPVRPERLPAHVKRHPGAALIRLPDRPEFLFHGQDERDASRAEPQVLLITPWLAQLARVASAAESTLWRRAARGLAVEGLTESERTALRRMLDDGALLPERATPQAIGAEHLHPADTLAGRRYEESAQPDVSRPWAPRGTGTSRRSGAWHPRPSRRAP